MMGGGKYDSIATGVRESTQAEGVVLLVLRGVHGSGFSMQADEAMTRALPDMLESMAQQIRRDITRSDALDKRNVQ